MEENGITAEAKKQGHRLGGRQIRIKEKERSKSLGISKSVGEF